MKKKITVFYTLALCLVFTSLASASGTELASHIQSAYKNLTDAKGAFVQKSFIKEIGETETYKGDFYMKIPSKMFYKYRQGSKDKVLVEGNTILLYQQNQNQVVKSKFDPASYGAAPVALLGGLGNLQREFNITEKNGKLLLTPKGPMGGITLLEIVPSKNPFPIKSMTMHMKSSTISLTFEDVKTNTGIKDSVFRLNQPAGAAFLDYTH